MTPRPYQRAAIDATWDWFRANSTGNSIIIAPTGSGKSLIQAFIVSEAVQGWPGTRVLMLCHVKELLAQNAKTLLRVWPEAPLGLHSAGLKQRDTQSDILVAGIQSIYKKAMNVGWFDLVLIDECHLISHENQGIYRSFLNDLKRINPKIRIIGLSATPFRTNHGSLMHGENALFHGVAYTIGMLDLIEQGYLAPLVTKRMATTLDVSGVAIRQGEFAPGQLERAVDQESITQAALDEVLRYGADRRSWLVFCCGVDHAEHVAEAMNARGIKTGCVTGKTPAVERDRLIQEYRVGRLRALTSMGVLTTGFDAPETDLLVLLRPTCSPGLFVQMVGRGMRVAPGKANCMILDFAGNTLRHGPIDQIEAWTPRPRSGGDAPAKVCPDCETICATSVRECPECGYEFPFDSKPKHESVAADAPILSTDRTAIAERVAVSDVLYCIHQGRDGKPNTLRADYYAGYLKAASEWLCFDHSGYPRAKAAAWWIRRAPGSLVPENVATAFARRDELQSPIALSVDTRAKYPEIKSYEFQS